MLFDRGVLMIILCLLSLLKCCICVFLILVFLRSEWILDGFFFFWNLIVSWVLLVKLMLRFSCCRLKSMVRVLRKMRVDRLRKRGFIFMKLNLLFLKNFIVFLD